MSDEEHVYYADADVTITSSRIVVYDHPASVADVASVAGGLTLSRPARRFGFGCAVSLLLLALPWVVDQLFVVTVHSHLFLTLFISGLFIAGGLGGFVALIGLLASPKRASAVHFTTSGGARHTYVTLDPDKALAVLSAARDAMAGR